MEEDKLPSYTDHDGYLMPRGFPVEGFASGLLYKAQPNDLFVATYPKCGTTWMQHIVYLILNDGEPISADQRVEDVFPHLEQMGKDFVSERAAVCGAADSGENARRYRLIKTHLPYWKTPQHPQAKYIVVVRNPKDCVVSFFHHTRGFPQHYDFADGSFDVYFDLFLFGKVDFNDYFDHLRSWMDRRNDTNVLFLKYEDVREDTRGSILKVAAFLDPDVYPSRLVANDGEILKRVLHHSSLDSMKKDPNRWSSKRPADHTPFIRQGSVGEWDELLQPEQAAKLDERMQVTCTPEEISFLGDKYKVDKQ